MVLNEEPKFQSIRRAEQRSDISDADEGEGNRWYGEGEGENGPNRKA